MLDRIIAQLALALFSYLERRIERGRVAVDADLDRDRLILAGSRIRKWVQQNGAGQGRQSDPDRTGCQGKGVCACRRRMDSEQQHRSNP